MELRLWHQVRSARKGVALVSHDIRVNNCVHFWLSAAPLMTSTRLLSMKFMQRDISVGRTHGCHNKMKTDYYRAACYQIRFDKYTAWAHRTGGSGRDSLVSSRGGTCEVDAFWHVGAELEWSIKVANMTKQSLAQLIYIVYLVE